MMEMAVMMADVNDGDGRDDGRCQRWRLPQHSPTSMAKTAMTMADVDDGEGRDDGRYQRP